MKKTVSVAADSNRGTGYPCRTSGITDPQCRMNKAMKALPARPAQTTPEWKHNAMDCSSVLPGTVQFQDRNRACRACIVLFRKPTQAHIIKEYLMMATGRLLPVRGTTMKQPYVMLPSAIAPGLGTASLLFAGQPKDAFNLTHSSAPPSSQNGHWHFPRLDC
jgi:hypothetical protein